MAKKKHIKTKPLSVIEPFTDNYIANRIQIFSSFEEQNEFELKNMATLSSIEILIQLRKFINIAYGMHGYDPNKLPTKHSIKIITPNLIIEK